MPYKDPNKKKEHDRNYYRANQQRLLEAAARQRAKVPPKRLALLPRFWSKVVKTEACYSWSGARDSSGYGLFSVRCKLVKAHRFAWELVNGPIPEGVQVLHRCDNPPCVRVEHLFLGSIQDNMNDRDAKGRQISFPGESHANHVLTEIEVREIREKAATGEYLNKDLAKEYGVSESCTSVITRRKGWKHLD